MSWWCSGGEIAYPNMRLGPSPCFLETCVMSISSLLLLLVAPFKLWSLLEKIPFSIIEDSYHRKVSYTLQFGTLLQALIIVVCRISEVEAHRGIKVTSPAYFYDSIIEIFGWTLISYIILLESWRYSRQWPSLLVKLFLGSNIVTYMFAAATSDQDTIKFLELLLEFFVALVLLCVSLLYNNFRSSFSMSSGRVDDLEKLSALDRIATSTSEFGDEFLGRDRNNINNGYGYSNYHNYKGQWNRNFFSSFSRTIASYVSVSGVDEDVEGMNDPFLQQQQQQRQQQQQQQHQQLGQHTRSTSSWRSFVGSIVGSHDFSAESYSGFDTPSRSMSNATIINNAASCGDSSMEGTYVSPSSSIVSSSGSLSPYRKDSSNVISTSASNLLLLQHQQQPIVTSALERNLDKKFGSSSSSSNSSSRSDTWKKRGVWGKSRDEEEDDAGGGGSRIVSQALARALVRERAKQAQNSPGLAPRGQLGFTSSRSEERDATVTSHGAMDSSTLEFHITVHRWGVRRKKLKSRDFSSSFVEDEGIAAMIGKDLSSANASAKPTPPTTLSQLQMQTTETADTSPLTPTSSPGRAGQSSPQRPQFDMSPPRPIADGEEVKTVSPPLTQSSPLSQDEVEFEIIIKGQSGRLNNNSSSHIRSPNMLYKGSGGIHGSGKNGSSSNLNKQHEEEDWHGVGGGAQKRTAKWSVWRTVDEILSLHAQLVSVLGDLAPRRPRLKISDLGVNATHNEIVADMRMITTYLMTLLRSRTYQIVPSFLDFLEVPDGYFRMQMMGVSGISVTGGLSSSLLLSSDGDTKMAFPALAILKDGVGMGGVGGGNGSLIGGGVGAGGNALSHSNSGEGELLPPDQLSSLDDQGLFGERDAEKSKRDTNLQRFAAAEAAELHINSQDRWRKVYVNMRVKLKPKEIAIRCRLFAGVISGDEVTSWLIRNSATSHQYQYAGDRTEACAIGQELLNCGLLVPITCGFDSDDIFDTNDNIQYDDDGENVMVGNTGCAIGGGDGTIATPHNSTSNNKEAIFSDVKGYLYRFPERSATVQGVGSFTIFGAPVHVEIPQWAQSEKTDDINVVSSSSANAAQASANDTTNTDDTSTTTSMLSLSVPVPPAPTQSGHIEYLVVVTHGDDVWQLWKRFREFEALSRSLAQLGVRPSASLPSKMISNSNSQLDKRKTQLEIYLNSALEATMMQQSDKANELMARFLDSDFDYLSFHHPKSSSN